VEGWGKHDDSQARPRRHTGRACPAARVVGVGSVCLFPFLFGLYYACAGPQLFLPDTRPKREVVLDRRVSWLWGEGGYEQHCGLYVWWWAVGIMA
jgi:hypothetical protein